MTGEKVMKKLTGLFWKCYNNDILRYIFWGGCTTLVNLISFYILRKCHLGLNTANVYSMFVFQDKCETLKDHIQPFVKFISARLVSMVVEVGGVWLLVEVMGLNDMIGKFITQFIVMALNYLFSKFFIFTTGKSKERK